jgi:hypothetical protein
MPAAGAVILLSGVRDSCLPERTLTREILDDIGASAADVGQGVCDRLVRYIAMMAECASVFSSGSDPG